MLLVNLFATMFLKKNANKKDILEIHSPLPFSELEAENYHWTSKRFYKTEANVESLFPYNQ